MGEEKKGITIAFEHLERLRSKLDICTRITRILEVNQDADDVTFLCQWRKKEERIRAEIRHLEVEIEKEPAERVFVRI